MEPIQYKLNTGELNQTYGKIKNCRVVAPPYVGDSGLYSKEFFLDKRFGLNPIFTLTDTGPGPGPSGPGGGGIQ